MSANTKRAAPSAWQMEQAMSIAMATVHQLEAEEVESDEDELRQVFRDQGADIDALMIRLLRAREEAASDITMIATRQEKLARRKQRIAARHNIIRATIQAMVSALPALFPDGKYQCAEFTVTVRTSASGTDVLSIRNR